MARLRKMGRLVAWTSATILALVALLLAAALWTVHRSVPTLDGPVRMTGLTAPVTVARDALGIAVVKGANRLDVARGLGFVHAQERFFEMDLARRSAAGELSALFGAVALERDKARRTHRLRAMLAARFDGLRAIEQALLQAYADGVNAGLAQLGTKPWQYLLLRAEPQRWKPVDSMLVVAEMFWMLQGASVDEGLERAQWRECVGDELFDWLEPRGGRWDAALDASVLKPGATPGPERLDLRHAVAAASQPLASVEAPPLLTDAATPDRHEPFVGSNNWAVTGARSVARDAMLANDMHLGLGVPSTWFRAQFDIGDGPGAVRAEGVTLPGVPALVVGSNGHVAWGFTNSYGQWFDWVKVPPGAALTHLQETIAVKGGADVTLDVAQFAGLPVAETMGGQAYALHWVADLGAAYSLALDDMLQARDIHEALAVAGLSGIPQQNAVVADRHGQIAWVVAGATFHPSVSAEARFGRFVAAGDVGSFDEPQLRPGGEGAAPSAQNPADGQLWTANARTYQATAGIAPVAAPGGLRVMAEDHQFATAIGDGGVDLGGRAQQIRDRLSATPKFDETTLGAIHFDDEARFLQPWAGRVAAASTGSTERPEVLALLNAWNGRADADQAGYRLVRGVRTRTLDALWAAWTKPLLDGKQCVMRKYDWHARFEYPAEQALYTRPAHLLPPGFASWDAFVLAQVDATVAEMTRHGARPLAQATWGEQNASHIGHVLSRAAPALSRWLDMPSLPQSGDNNMPHVAGPSFGQSERLVVAPGHEERATLSMPGGQSGHPMSPYYGAGHDAWVAGRTTPLLAGTAEHTLTLSP
ncbi:MAG: penicillin acylase family protein [Betaproteobacteria bacterium]